MTDPDSLSLDRCVDGGGVLDADLRRRIDRDPHLRRDLRRLRQLDHRLREELPSLRASATAPLEARVLGALRGAPGRRAPSRTLRYAAAAALLLGLGAWFVAGIGGEVEGTTAPAEVARSESPARPGVDLAGLALRAPERPLLVEADNLARDTRRVARSLLGQLPLSSWLTRGRASR